MNKRRVTVTIDPDIEDWLDAGVKCYGRSLSEVIRICLREFHDAEPDRFSRRNRAREETPEPWRVIRKEDGAT